MQWVMSMCHTTREDEVSREEQAQASTEETEAKLAEVSEQVVEGSRENTRELQSAGIAQLRLRDEELNARECCRVLE